MDPIWGPLSGPYFRLSILFGGDLKSDPNSEYYPPPKGCCRFTLRLTIAQKPYIVWSLGPKALKYASLEAKG